MARFIARAVVTLALLYFGAATVFAFAHYEGERPDVPTVLADFHAWAGSLVASRAEPAPRPAPAVPPPAPPAPPAPVKMKPPPPPPEPTPAERVARELTRIEEEVLPKAEAVGTRLRSMPRGDGVEFDRVRTEGMALLSEARDYVGSVLDKESGHKQANRVWTKIQEMWAAFKRL